MSELFTEPAAAFKRRRAELEPQLPEVKRKPVKLIEKLGCFVVPNTQGVARTFPDWPVRKLHGVPHRILRYNYINAYLLGKLGYDAQSPIVTEYHWPGPDAPFEVQIRTAELLTMETHAYVLNNMGTGKTRAALWAWDYLYERGLTGKLLVAAPLSTLYFVWGRECFSVVPHRRYEVLHGTREQRLDRLKNPDADIFIINHDGLKIIADKIAGKADTWVIDELATYRNLNDRTRVAERLAKKMKRVWGMTGSPIPTAPTDVYYQAAIITPNTIPQRFTHFRDKLMLRVDQFTWVPKKDAVQKAYKALTPAVRFSLEDVLELPPVIERTIDVPLGPKQAKAYEQLRAVAHTMVDNNEITAANAGAAMSKLLQVSLGWVYRGDGKVVVLDNRARLDAMMEIIWEAQNKVLVFAPYKHALRGISRELKRQKIDHETVSGETPNRKRNEIFSIFQNTDRFRVLPAHPQCLAHGVTLTAADTIIWFGPIASLETFIQANARITRIGQKKKQQIFRLAGTPVERRLYGMLDAKQDRQDTLLKMFAEATAERLK